MDAATASSTAPLPASLIDAKHILCVFAPLRIHSRWEKLVIGSPIHEANLNALPWLKKLLVFKSYGQYCRANPRSAHYMSQWAADLLAEHASDVRVDALISSFPVDTLSPRFKARVNHLWTVPNDVPLANYDCVLLLYPDAIGYGWGSIEKKLQKPNVAPIVASNGRRRTFIFTDFRRRLQWRRFLEATWILEVILLVALGPLSLLAVLHPGSAER